MMARSLSKSNFATKPPSEFGTGGYFLALKYANTATIATIMLHILSTIWQISVNIIHIPSTLGAGLNHHYHLVHLKKPIATFYFPYYNINRFYCQ
jgi:hypothetical protein